MTSANPADHSAANTGPAPVFSILICSIDAAKFGRVTEMYRSKLIGHAMEIIGIHDARSLAEGYNRGLARCRGEVIILSHDDVEFIGEDFAGRVLEHLKNFDLIGVAGTSRLEGPMWSYAGLPYIHGQVAHAKKEGGYEVQIFDTHAAAIGGIQSLDGACLIAARRVFDKVRFDAERFTAFHGYDVDFTFSAYLAGLRLAAVSDLPMIHESEGRLDQTWYQSNDLFMAKRAWRLHPFRRRKFYPAYVMVHSRQEVLEVMSPAHLKPNNKIG